MSMMLNDFKDGDKVAVTIPGTVQRSRAMEGYAGGISNVIVIRDGYLSDGYLYGIRAVIELAPEPTFNERLLAMPDGTVVQDQRVQEPWMKVGNKIWRTGTGYAIDGLSADLWEIVTTPGEV